MTKDELIKGNELDNEIASLERIGKILKDNPVVIDEAKINTQTDCPILRYYEELSPKLILMFREMISLRKKQAMEELENL